MSQWIGTWSSNIHDEAYGSLSVSKANDEPAGDIRVTFEGEIYPHREIIGSGDIPTEIKPEIKSSLVLSSIMTQVNYTLVDVSYHTIKGTYYCDHPTDNGSFYLTRFDMDHDNSKDME